MFPIHPLSRMRVVAALLFIMCSVYTGAPAAFALEESILPPEVQAAIEQECFEKHIQPGTDEAHNIEEANAADLEDTTQWEEEDSSGLEELIDDVVATIIGTNADNAFIECTCEKTAEAMLELTEVSSSYVMEWEEQCNSHNNSHSMAAGSNTVGD